MNFPVDRMIDNVQSKTAAVSKNVGKDTRTLDQKVIDIVASANKMALPDRQVVPRNTLIVMQRAMNELSSLSDESREAGVLREVNKFISLNQNTFSNSDAYTKHTDLLPAGHPLSDHNSSLSTEDYLQRYAAWLSADPGISDDVRHLVAAAYSQLPGSPQREHAFIRLNTIKASSLPAYFKIDIPALVAAFSFGDGNSSAARRARVKLQWRDRLGRWVEMGRGINFKFRLPDGGVATAAGTYVGSDANAGYSGNWARKEANNGLVEIKGDTNIPDGIYSINNGNAESFKARLSKSDLKRAGVDTPKNSRYRLSSKFDESIPDLSDLLATKVDAPSGWTKNEDGSFTSDDDYKAVKKDDGYEVYRLDLEGNTGDKVGDAKTWADVQNVAAADEEAYDKYKEDVESGQLPLGDGERPEPRYSRMNREVQQEIKQLKDQIPQNEESNRRIEDQLERALSGKDSQGRDLPEGWYSKIDPNEISETYYKDIPGATRKDEYLVATVGREGKINYGTGGFWFNNARPTESWDQITEDTPKIIDQINQGRASIGLAPIEPDEDKNTKNYNKVDRQIAFLRPGDLIPAYFPTRGGKERLLDERERNPNFEMPPVDEILQVGTYRGIDPNKVVLRVKNIESGEERRFEISKNATMYDTRVPSSEPVQTKPAVSDKEIFDRRMAGESLQEVADSLGIPREEVRAREAKYARENSPAGEDDGPDEPPSPGGGTPPKSPAPSNPAAPALFREFDVPAGAFQLRTVEYEPEGRVDEASTDFTDAPNKIAVRFPLDTLVRAFTRSLIGDVDENVIDEIVDINDDGEGNLPDLSEVGDVLENNLPINVPRGERPRASGAGSLEFNAGSEFVQAEALYNAVWLAGGDPNRVIANAYDAVNGNRDNLSKLLEAQGGVPTSEEEKLIVDIIDEIKQIDDATPEEEKPITNADTGIDEDDMEFPGGLIENVPVDFNNPDYYDMDLSPYISTILEPDELGYTDNPKYIAIMVKSSSDLIQQMKSGITDGTGMALVRFNDDSTSEVPVEAIRDALQYQGINTNDILFKLRDESNDMSEAEPTRAPDSTIGPKYVELPNGYTIIRRDNRNSPDLGYISIVKEGAEVGSLYWNRDTKVVENIQINPEHRGKGVAKAVWEGAKRYEPELKHSQYRTPAGDKFARSTGDYVPPLIPMGDWTQAELDEAQAQPQPESTSLVPEQIFNQKIKDRNGGEFELNLVKIGDIFEGAVIDKQDGTIQIIVRNKDKKKAKTELTQARDSIKTSAAGDEAMLGLPNLDRVESPAVAEPQAPNLQAHSQKIKDLIEQAGGTVDDETADKIRDAINQKGLVDWSEADDAEIIEAITEVAGSEILAKALAELAPETPALVLDYPGPRKKGYSSENTTLDRNGNVVGEGSTIQAVTDGKTGKVLKIQDSPAYLRIEFTDGTVAVRSANKIVAVSNKDGSKPSKPSAAAAPSEIQRDPVEISRRLDTPVTKAPAVARSGDIYGVNDESTVPDSIKELTQVNVAQKDFAQWGVRDAEIAKAATGRVAIEPLYELVANYVKDTKKTGDDKPSRDELIAANSKVQEIIADTFGDRTGVSFGSKFYTVTRYGTGYFASELELEEDNVGKIKFEYSGKIRNESGNPIGTVTRSVTIEKIKNQDGTFSYKIKPYNSYMKVDSKANQKTGFASAYNRYMENWYIANNTEQVRVFAAAGAGFEGGFVWALNGFDWDLSRNDSVSEIKYALSRLRRESETVYEKAVADIIINRFKDALDPVTQKYDASRLPTPMDVALAGWREGSTNWPGRRAMLDTGWHGVKNLVPSAREQVQVINYRKIKNAERRVKTGQNKPNLSSATLSYLNSNEFQTEHAELGTSIDIIRSVLRNNESLATLSESDKVKLNNMVTKEIFFKDSKIPTDDIYRLRTALIKEYSADYSSADPFSTVGEALTKFSVKQFEDANELEAAGFKVEGLSDAEGAGINQTYRVTHKDSGQVFYVKDDSTTRDRINEQRDSKNSDELNYPTIVGELEASVLFNLSGLLGTYSTRGSTTDENLIVMSSAGATLPTYESPINASDMFSLGLNTPSGQKFYGIDSKKLVDNLKSPEDIFRVHIVDALMNNMDRHVGNWKAAIDLIDNKILVFPVDHTLTDLNVNDALALAETKEFLDYGRAGSALYKDTIPAIIDRAGQERAYEVYKNEVQRMIDNINDPLVAPKENELAFLISKWGSYDAFKDSMKKRLSAMIEDGTEVNTSLRRIFNRRRGI